MSDKFFDAYKEAAQRDAMQPKTRQQENLGEHVNADAERIKELVAENQRLERRRSEKIEALEADRDALLEMAMEMARTESCNSLKIEGCYCFEAEPPPNEYCLICRARAYLARREQESKGEG